MEFKAAAWIPRSCTEAPRPDEIETSKTSGASSSTITYSEEEVEEMEGVIGEITKELAELKAVHKHDEVEYECNRLAVANFRSKYRELADPSVTFKK